MSTIKMPVKRPYNWRLLALIAVAIIPISFITLPYALTTVGADLAPGELTQILISALINSLIYILMATIGLYAASRIGLGLPFLEGWLKKQSIRERFPAVAKQSILFGVIAAVVIIALAALVFSPLLQAELNAAGIVIPEERRPPAWQGFLASFYGGITEEVQMRLFVMSLLAAFGGLFFKNKEGRPKLGVLWVANILAAVVFGLGHLPSGAAMGIPLTPLFITRTVFLNAIGGVVFGWLYMKNGLESAMIAHFSGDIVVHVLWPILISLLA